MLRRVGGGGRGLLALQAIGVIVRDVDIDGLAVVIESDDEAVSRVIQTDIVSQQPLAVLALRIGLEGGQEKAVSNPLLIHGSPVDSPLVLLFNAVDVLRGQTPLAVDRFFMLEIAFPQPRERVIRSRGSVARATRACLLAAGVERGQRRSGQVSREVDLDAEAGGGSHDRGQGSRRFRRSRRVVQRLLHRGRRLPTQLLDRGTRLVQDAGVVLQDAGPVQQAVHRALQVPRQTAGSMSARVSAHPLA